MSVNWGSARPASAEKTERERNRLWGDEVTPKQIGKYGSEKWEKKPLIVWAKPGESGDGYAAESWLDERGKPLEKSPWNQDESARSREGRPSPETDMQDHNFFDGDVLLLGQESAGVPDAVAQACAARVRIPMISGVRSMNLASSAALVAGEALRQVGGLPG